MTARGQGRIVIVASLMGRLTVAGAAVYGATKHAVVALAETIREETRSSGVEVTTVLPSIVHTEASSGVEEGRGLPAGGAGGRGRRNRQGLRAGRRRRSRSGMGRPAGADRRGLPRMLLRPVRRALGRAAALNSLDERERAEYEERLGGS